MLRRFLLVFVLAACCSAAFAQSTSASLTGLVDDPAKALIPGATITAINTQTGEKASTTTNKEGQYVLPGLNPGSYRIEVDKPGFKGIIEAGLTLHVQDAVQINFHMAIGSSAESVTVTADQINMNTTDGTVSTVIDQSYIANMPLNGRSFQDLILLTPGVVTNSPQGLFNNGIGGSGEFSVNGQRTESNYYTVDGASANVGAGPALNMIGALGSGAGASGSLGASTALGTTQGLASVDDLQEFRVQSSTYSAEYGRNPGGQFAFETKAGSKQVHGTLSEYLRNGFFDAPDWFNDYFDIPYPQVHQNDFGGTFGGPVRIPKLYGKKDETFFFFSYEGLRLLSPVPASINYVPDAETRATAAPALQPILASNPVPNGPDIPGQGFAEFIGTWSNPSSIDSTSIRLDHAIRDKTNIFFRFSETNSDSISRFTDPPSCLQGNFFALKTYTFGENNAFSTRLANEMRLNYTSNNVNSGYFMDSFGGANPNINLGQASGFGADAVLEFNIISPSGAYLGGPAQGPTYSAQTQWNLVDSMSFISGNHQMKFGVDYRRLTPLINIPPFGSWDFYVGTELETNSTPYTYSNNYAANFPLFHNFSAFAEDEWRANRRLNLSLGIRWDVNPPPGVTHGPPMWTMIGTDNPNTATLAPEGTPLWHTTWFDFGPRLGAAYTAHNTPGRETVVRGGMGVFFDTGQQLGTADSNFGPGSYSNDPGSASESYPNLPPLLPIVEPTPPYTGLGNLYSFNAYAPHLQLPYTLQWNFSLQQAFGKVQSLTVSYVGSHASRLLQANEIQAPNNPVTTGYGYVENGLTSDYNSLQAQFQRRLSAGLTAIASYTWSHCFDYGSTNAFIGYQRGNCDFDVRDNFSTAFSYDIPTFGEAPLARAIVGKWGLDNRFTARSAFPVAISGNGIIEPDGKVFPQGINLVPNEPIYLYGANCISTFLAIQGVQPGQSCPGGRGINPNAFTSVAGNALGDAPRNFLRGFGAMQWDVAARREFPIYERLKLQFRAEAFNVLNHPNFGNVNGGWGGNTFGLATATLANSLGILSPLYQMGGARSMQFALKFVF